MKRNVRREYWNFIKEKRYALSAFCLSLLLLGISGMVLLPHMMQQWSRDGKVGVLHVILGIIIGAIGLTMLFRLLKHLAKDRGATWRRNLGHLFLWYMAIQIVSGVVQGMIGLCLYKTGVLTYERTKTVLYIITSVWQNLLRVWFLYWIVNALYGDQGKNHKKTLLHAELIAIILSVITIALTTLESGIWQHTITVVWEVLFLAWFTIYFGVVQGRKQIK